MLLVYVFLIIQPILPLIHCESYMIAITAKAGLTRKSQYWLLVVQFEHWAVL